MEEEEVQLIQIGLHTYRLLKKPNGTYRSEPLPPLHRKEEGIPLIPKEDKTLGIFDSASKPGDKHYVRITPHGTIYCTCWGFRAPDKCWHYRGMMEAIKSGQLHPNDLKEPLIIKLEEPRKKLALETPRNLGSQRHQGS